MAVKRTSDYRKANDGGIGLRVSFREPNCPQAHGLQCCYCIGSGREEKVVAKRKPSSDIQG